LRGALDVFELAHATEVFISAPRGLALLFAPFVSNGSIDVSLCR